MERQASISFFKKHLKALQKQGDLARHFLGMNADHHHEQISGDQDREAIRKLCELALKLLPHLK
jgi:hypothetical protein